MLTAKKCPKCQTTKNVSLFVKHRGRANGITSLCRECHRLTSNLHFSNNRTQECLRFRKQRAKWKETNPIGYKLSHMAAEAKRRARRTGLPFDIDVKYLSEIMVDCCPVLGVKLNYESAFLADNSPSLDRFQPDLGYVRGNLYIMSFRANRLKMDATPNELMKLALWAKQMEEDRNPPKIEFSYPLYVGMEAGVRRSSSNARE